MQIFGNLAKLLKCSLEKVSVFIVHHNIYININLFKQNELNEDHQEINESF